MQTDRPTDSRANRPIGSDTVVMWWWCKLQTSTDSSETVPRTVNCLSVLSRRPGIMQIPILYIPTRTRTQRQRQNLSQPQVCPFAMRSPLFGKDPWPSLHAAKAQGDWAVEVGTVICRTAGPCSSQPASQQSIFIILLMIRVLENQRIGFLEKE